METYICTSSVLNFCGCIILCLVLFFLFFAIYSVGKAHHKEHERHKQLDRIFFFYQQLDMLASLTTPPILIDIDSGTEIGGIYGCLFRFPQIQPDSQLSDKGYVARAENVNYSFENPEDSNIPDTDITPVVHLVPQEDFPMDDFVIQNIGEQFVEATSPSFGTVKVKKEKKGIKIGDTVTLWQHALKTASGYCLHISF